METIMSESSEKITLEVALEGINDGVSLATQRGLDDDSLSYLAFVVEQMIEQDNARLALAGCQFLCAHDDNNPRWWLLHGQVARAAKLPVLAISAFLTGFAIYPGPQFCVELARTYLTVDRLDLATQAVEAGQQIIKYDGDMEGCQELLASLTTEISRRKTKENN